MKKIITFFAVAITLIACTSEKQLNNPAVGEVFDASMNNVSIITQNNDTLNFSTLELNDAGKNLGVFIGDTISVAYKNFEGEQARPDYFNATEMTLIYRQPQYYLTGQWVEPNPINATQNQGFVFNADGTAETIGMATLGCSKWSLNDGKLTLTMTSEGSGEPTTSDITYTVKTLNDKSLVLCDGENVVFNLSHPQQN